MTWAERQCGRGGTWSKVTASAKGCGLRFTLGLVAGRTATVFRSFRWRLPANPVKRAAMARLLAKCRRLHLGCGTSRVPGWINVDVLPVKGVDFRCDLRRLRACVPDGAIDEILISHTLEHFMRDDIRTLLADFHAMLREGGGLWISVPSLDLWYEAAKNLRSPAEIDRIMGILLGGGRDRHDIHRCVFTSEYMQTLLHEAGFRDISSWTEPPAEFRNVPGGWQASIDGRRISLNCLARK
jgi:predicted SAM-dependent methyltransferase